MQNFSASRAIGAGFRLIGREPLAVLVWTAAYFLIGILPQLLIFSAILPDWAGLMREASASSARGETLAPADMMRLQARMMQLQPTAWLAAIISQTVLVGAIFRATLFPEDRRYFYLRLSMRELWLGLVMIVLTIALFVLMFAIMLPTAAIGAIVGATARQTPAIGLLMFLVIPAALGLFCWVILRLSLAPVMSFARSEFEVPESWSLTRGHAWKMFCVLLALIALALIAEMIVLAICLTAGGATLLSPKAMEAWFKNPHLDVFGPVVLGVGMLIALFSVAAYAVGGAAWAEIYRGLTREPAD
jgi:hypothetical protein